MGIELTHTVLAVVTSKDSDIHGGAAPIFRIEDTEERERLAMYLSKVLVGTVHDLTEGTYVVIKH